METYRSPVHIIPSEQLSQLETIDLKQLRKQLLLRLELAGGTTLEIKGREYDRNGLLQAIEALQQDLEQHVRLFKNKPLLAFIEQGAIDFFEQPVNWKDFADPVFQYWLMPLFTQRYQLVMYKCVSEKGYYSINRLRILYQTAFQLPPAYQDNCYQKAYGYLQQMAVEANELTSLTFEKRDGLLFADPKVDVYVNSHLFNVFANLPDYFQPLAQQYEKYTIWLIYSAFKNEAKFADFDRSALITLRYAAQISAHIRKDHNFTGLANGITQHLAEVAQEKSNAKEGLAFLTVYVVAFILVVIFFLIGPCTRKTLDRPAKAKPSQLFEVPTDEERLRAQLNGDWQSIIAVSDSSLLVHQYSFSPTGTGTSLYYFPQKEGSGHCSASMPFSWNLVVEKRGQKNFCVLLLQYRKTTYQEMNCKLEKMELFARDIFFEVHNTQYTGHNLENISLSTAPNDTTYQTLIFKKFGEAGAIYKKMVPGND